MQNLKEIERTKRIERALTNFRLAESKVSLHENKVQEIKQNHNVDDIHVNALLRQADIELNSAKRDLEQARETLMTAEADDDVLDTAMERMSI